MGFEYGGTSFEKAGGGLIHKCRRGDGDVDRKIIL